MNAGAFSIFCPCKGECCFLTNPCFLHFLSEEPEAMEYHIPSPSAHKTRTGAENYYTIFPSFGYLNTSLFDAPGIVLGSDKQVILKWKPTTYIYSGKFQSDVVKKCL